MNKTQPVAKTRNTRQRVAILKELRRFRSHPTADELYVRVRETIPNISLGTVYRNLDVLCEQGEILRLESSSGPCRYDGNPANHHHIQCMHCGAIKDVKPDQVEPPEFTGELPRGFRLVGYRLDLLGICSECDLQHPEPAGGASTGTPATGSEDRNNHTFSGTAKVADPINNPIKE